MGTHPIFESDFDCLTDGRLLFEPYFGVTGRTHGRELFAYRKHYKGTGQEQIHCYF